MEFKVGDKVRFKNRNPDIPLEITEIYNTIAIVRGVERLGYVSGCALEGLEALEKGKGKLKQKTLTKKVARKKPEDFWP